ncbi:MAG TPA: hypothetical protein VH186_02590 [Chloroflexia bacterium]|nr:hypothetical protein [Chloroflexia bacterium]
MNFKLTRRVRLLVMTLALLLTYNLALTPFTASAATPDQVASFRKLWARTDNLVDDGAVSRSWVWGPKALDYSYVDSYRYNSTDKPAPRAFRHYDKGRMEIDPRQPVGSKWYIRGGSLVKEMVTGRVSTSEDGGTATLNPLGIKTPADVPVVGDDTLSDATPTYATFTDYSTPAGFKSPDRRGQSVTKLINRYADTVQINTGDPKAKIALYVPETGHNVPQAFVDYFNSQGPVQDASGNTVTEPLFDWVYVFGYPITEPYWAKVMVGGKQTLVMLQLFERRVLSYTPSNSPAWQVEMGNAGLHYLSWRSHNDLTFSGPARISLDKFRQVLQSYNSPVTGQAGDLYATIVRYGLDPAVALAFFVRESGAGTAVGYCNGQNSLDNKNWGNVRGEEDGACGFQKFPTWQAGLEAWCRLMIKYYVNRGLDRLEDAVPVYAPAADGNDTHEYINTMWRLVLKWEGYLS